MIVVDDQDLVRRAIVRCLDPDNSIEVVGEARVAKEALTQVAVLAPDVVLVDDRMPTMTDGVELVRQLVEDHPDIATVVLTTLCDDPYIFAEAGAKGYLLKDAPLEELILAIRRTSQGEPFLKEAWQAGQSTEVGE